jgi:hypothetical protein
MLLTVFVNGHQFSRPDQSIDAAFAIVDAAEFMAEKLGEPVPLIEVRQNDNGGEIFWTNARKEG